MSHGLNQYRDSNTLIYIAAIHPNPMTIALYKSVIPQYDYLKDHLADSCTQAVTRLCIRDVESETIAYVLLPDLGTAELLRDKLLTRPTISTRAINGAGLMALSRLNAERSRDVFQGTPEEKKARRDSQNRAARKRYLNNDVNIELQRLRTRRYYCKKKLQAEPQNPKLLERLEEIERTIQDLKSQAKQTKD